MAQSYDRRINLYINIDGKEVKNNVASIRTEMNKLVNQQSRMTIGSQEYIASTRKIQQLKGIMAKHQQEIAGINKSWSMKGMADGFNKYFGMITAGIASLTGLVMGFKQVIKTFNDYEERVDNLSALTGLAGKSLDWLSQKAKDLSTATLEGGIRVTQGAQEIVDAFTKTGSARPELLKNKEALVEVTQEAIILAAAAKTELQPAIEALTMVLNQYNVPADQSRRIINALAAGSKEGAGEIPYLTAAFEKSGTVAADAGISIETLVATIETLAPRITQPEIAGRSLKGVLLDLQNGADDTNPAIVGMATALENMGKKNLSVTELTKKFGVENITTAKILIDNVGELKKYEKAVTGTNVALEQAAINTDNNNARLAQAKNRLNVITIALGEKLAPALTMSTNSLSYLIKGLSVAIEFFATYKRSIIIVTAAILAYVGRLQLLILWEYLKHAAIKKGLILSNLQAVAIRIQIAMTDTATMAQKRALVATRALNAGMKGTPWGLIISLATAGGVALYQYAQKKKEAADATGNYNKILKDEIELTKGQTAEIIAEKFNLNSLVRSVISVNDNENLRKILIMRIKEEFPDFLKGIDAETVSNEQLRAKLDQVNTQYSERIRLKGLQARVQAITNAATKGEERKLEIEDRLAEIEKDRFMMGDKKADKEIKALSDEYKQLNINLSVYEQKTQEAVDASTKLNQSIVSYDSIKFYREQLTGLEGARKTYQDNLTAATEKGNKDEIAHYAEQIRLTDQQIILFKNREKELIEATKAAAAKSRLGGDNTDGTSTGSESDDKKKKASDKAISILEQANNARTTLLNTQYETEKWSEEKFKSEQLDMELVYLVQKKAILTVFGQDTIDIDKEINDNRLKELQNRNDQMLEKEKDFNKQMDKADKDFLKQTEDNNQTEEAILANNVDATGNTIDASLKSLEKSRDKELFLLEQRAQTYQAISETVVSTLSDIFNGSLDEYASYGDALVLMSLQILKQMVPIWSAQILGFSLADPVSVATVGIKGMANFAIVTGLMYAGIAAAEGAVKKGINNKKNASSGYASGGYTGAGGKYEAAGIVHKGEWVANAELVRDPYTGSIIAGLQAMQESRLSVTSGAIQASRGNGYSSGGMAGSSTASPSASPGGGAPLMGAGISNEQLTKLNSNLDRLMKWKPKLYTEQVKKDLDEWENIEANRGL